MRTLNQKTIPNIFFCFAYQSKALYLWCDILEMLLQQQCLGGLGVQRVLGKDEVAGSNPARGFFVFLFKVHFFILKSDTVYVGIYNYNLLKHIESLNTAPISDANKKLILKFIDHGFTGRDKTKNQNLLLWILYFK